MIFQARARHCARSGDVNLQAGGFQDVRRMRNQGPAAEFEKSLVCSHPAGLAPGENKPNRFRFAAVTVQRPVSSRNRMID
jgi:hypothetical protein